MVAIHLKNITSSTTYEVVVEEGASVHEIRSAAAQQPDLSEHAVDDLQLILNGKYLEDTTPISDLLLPENHTIFVLVKKTEAPKTTRENSEVIAENPAPADDVAPSKPVHIGNTKSSTFKSTMRTLAGKEPYKPSFELPSIDMDDKTTRYVVGALVVVAGYLLGLAFLWAVAVSTKKVYTDLQSGGVGPVVGVCFAFLIAVAIALIALVVLTKSDGLVATCSCVCCIAMIICVFVLGCAAGKQYYEAVWISAAPLSSNTNPTKPYDGVSRAFNFMVGTYVDVNRGAWQLVRQGKSSVSYCVAPVVLDPSVASANGANFTSVSGQQDQIAYWVYGQGTCCSSGAYKCAWWRTSARAAVLTPDSKTTWATRIRPMALSAWRLSLLGDSQFVLWTDDVENQLAAFNKKGEVLTAVFTWGWPTMFLGASLFLCAFILRFAC